MLKKRVFLKGLRALFEPMYGKLTHQAFFERLHQYSLKGLSAGSGAYTEDSSERLTIQQIKDFYKDAPKLVCFDVGANVGQFTTLLHQVMGDQAIIHSFEPSAATFQNLQKNTAAFSGVTVHHLGLGESPGKLQLFTNNDTSLIASLYPRRLDHFGIQMDKNEEVDILTLDGFCAQNNISHIHFLKMDVEGHELSVLKGGKALLQSAKIDFIQFEFGGCNIDSRTYFQDFWYLLSNDYTIYRIVKDGLYEIRAYHETLENFITTNFLARRKQLNASVN